MIQFNMSKLQIDGAGNYRDTNGNIVAKKGLPLTGAAWKYLASKYGNNYANNVSKNTRSGNTYLNGKWASNGILANNKKQWQPNKSQEESPTSIGGKLLKGFGDWTGLYHMGSATSDLAGTATYFIPGLGNAMSAGDAFNAARRGDWGNAAMNAVFALPFIGNIGKGIKTGLLAAKFAKAASRVGKGVEVLNKVNKPAKYALNATLAYDVPNMGYTAYNTYLDVKQAKLEYLPLINLVQKLRLQGVSENDLKKVLGDSYGQLNTLASRKNSFTGNVGTMWDLISK